MFSLMIHIEIALMTLTTAFCFAFFESLKPNMEDSLRLNFQFDLV